MNVLLIAPLMDVPTITSNMAVWELIRYGIKKPDIKLDVLWFLRANRFTFNSMIHKKTYDLVIYYGHGATNKLYGNHIFSSMIDAKNIRGLKNGGISTMACYSAKELGVWAIKDGIKAYIGTITPYYAAFSEKEHDFLHDWIDYTTSKDKALMDGYSFQTAYNLFIKKANYYLNQYKEKYDYKNYDWYYETLKSNIENTILLGDGNYIAK